jgi:hypothetical protein
MIRRTICRFGRPHWDPVSWIMAVAAVLVGATWAISAPSLRAAVQAPAGVEVRVSADPQIATVGDLIHIDILVTAPEGFAVQVPDPGHRIASFDVLEFFPGPDVPREKEEPADASEEPGHGVGTSVHRARIVAAIYRTGEFDFPALRITLRDPGGKETAVESTPVRVEIRSVLGADDQQLKDLRNQAEIPGPFRWKLWLGALAALLAVLAAVYWLRRRRRAPAATVRASPPAPDPLDAAEAELRELVGGKLLEKGLVKQFYVTLADVVKKMLEAGYGVQALEKTSLEILEALPREESNRLRDQDLEEIAGLMVSCDLVKFARYIPGEQENGTAVESAFRILQVCRHARSVPPAPLMESVPETS